MVLIALSVLTILVLAGLTVLLLTRIAALNSRLEGLEHKHSADISSIVTKQDMGLSSQDKHEKSFRDELGRNRQELADTLKNFGDLLDKQLKNINEASRHDLTQMRQTIETKVKDLQVENSKKLDEMRLTVDEKLQGTLEKRISMSFKQVSERLEQVYKGLGEMQTLAAGVGDLKKVLTNVKTRGTWGEMQLANLLEEILSPDQYEENVQTKPRSQERVDFAIKLPGQDDHPVWLPIDSKFPQEDYQKLVEAHEAGDPALAEQAHKQLEARIKLEGKTIRDKYLSPPRTTDFGLLFLPTEGLYAEVVRMPGLIDRMQRDYRVNVVGPTTLAALLNSLQMGFRTLSIQKRSSEVWKLLADIKKHFGSFGDLLGKAYDKVQQAGKVIEDAGRRSRTIETKLKKVQELPGSELDQESLIESMQKN
ncbi:MAG: DNA recombination protein RmuC [Candidatus Melainabacteria bacterium]|nr:DNA recombination protein RmuC [Candidatus Melainabacteria bacterium]